MPLDDARRVVEAAIAAHTFPAAAVEAGGSAGVLWARSFGRLTFDADAPAALDDTIFDLASLTKPLATGSAAMEMVRTGALALDAPVFGFFDEWRGIEREAVTVRDLLEHASGLPARLVDQPPATRREFEHDISTIALEYPPRSRSIYSDLGFILLAFLLERIAGAALPSLFDPVLAPLRVAPPEYLGFEPPPPLRGRCAPTLPMDVDPRRGRRLAGEVHDNYAAALGGAAGHAGLFGTAAGVGAFARAFLRAARGLDGAPFSTALVPLFVARSGVPGSSRALAWDTMLPTSSCGTRMSAQAFGHVGYTGTSVWIDPARDRYFVLLTNRACGGGTLEEMRAARRAFHDALGDL